VRGCRRVARRGNHGGLSHFGALRSCLRESSGVVDQDVDVTELVGDPLGGSDCFPWRGHVEHDAPRLDVSAVQLARRHVYVRLRTAGNDHGESALTQCSRAPAAPIPPVAPVTTATVGTVHSLLDLDTPIT